MSELPLTFMLIGPPKAGKDWLSATAPKPLLIIDIEGRARYTPQGQKATFWDGVNDPMELEKSESQTYILQSTEVPVIDTALRWLRTGKHPFKSLALNSVMEYRYIVIQSVYPGVQDIPRNAWGKPNSILEQALRDMRNLAMSQSNPINCVIFVTGATTDIESGKVKPMVRGTVGELSIYWMDLVGYLTYDSKTMKRVLYIGPNPMDAEVGDATNRIVTKLGVKITDPDVTTMYEALQSG